jgi:hypothetical protein
MRAKGSEADRSRASWRQADSADQFRIASEKSKLRIDKDVYSASLNLLKAQVYQINWSKSLFSYMHIITHISGIRAGGRIFNHYRNHNRKIGRSVVKDEEKNAKRSPAAPIFSECNDCNAQWLRLREIRNYAVTYISKILHARWTDISLPI